MWDFKVNSKKSLVYKPTQKEKAKKDKREKKKAKDSSVVSTTSEQQKKKKPEPGCQNTSCDLRAPWKEYGVCSFTSKQNNGYKITLTLNGSDRPASGILWRSARS